MLFRKKHNDELITRFIHNAEKAAATVERIKNSPRALKKTLLNRLSEDVPFLLAEPDRVSQKYLSYLYKMPNAISHPNEDQLSSVKIGVTDAFSGVARTGSVCVSVSENLGGSISLFTREHIVILDGATIVDRPRDLFTDNRFQKQELIRNFVFITGPSATADMGPLVRGVHGPGKLHIILLE